MTTIVYDHKNKQVAVDSRSTANNLIVSDKTIKFKENEKGLWFFTGSRADEDDLAGLEHNDKPEVKPDCSAFIVSNGVCKLVTFNGDYVSVSNNEYNHAIGSGSDFALAALDFGKSAKEAIEYAKTRDSATGGKVHVYDIQTGEFIN